MPLLFWYPMIVWSGMIGLALEHAQPKCAKSASADHAKTENS